jgi:hypothetical protein
VDARTDLIEQAANMSVAEVKQAVQDLSKAKAEPDAPRQKEWEPIKLFRSIGTKAKKINFDSIPASKKKELTKAIQRVQELVEEINNIS